MILVFALLIGLNYLMWSRYMTLVSRVKDKLGFINGIVSVSELGTSDYEK